MKIRLVEYNHTYKPFWKIEEQWCETLNVWANYFSKSEKIYLSYEEAKSDYDMILAGKMDGDAKILEETEI